MGSKYTVCCDFDGCIHAYSSGWKGWAVIPDPPVEGAFDWIKEMVKHASVAIYSARSHNEEARKAMREWFLEHDMPEDIVNRLRFPEHKPPARIFIDDRAWQFTGKNFPSVQEVKDFEPWWNQ